MAPSDKKKTPQEVLSAFWERFHTKKPGKVTSIFPRSLYTNLLPPLHPKGVSSARNAAESYEAAAAECRAKIARIVRECERTNEKFTDPDFDIEGWDPDENCLYGLVRNSGGESGGGVDADSIKGALDILTSANMFPGSGTLVDITALRMAMEAGGEDDSSDSRFNVGSTHRLDYIFEKPTFTDNGFSSSDIQQGGNGDCWFIAAIANVAHRQDIMEKICVARDEECGVYGFVFQRDGEWVSTVVDDNLYLTTADFDKYFGGRHDPTGKLAREHRRLKQTGSDALTFARCVDQNETWLPLLEKAYAKIHGDYAAIQGGYSGEGVEDLTGGVNTVIKSNRIIRKDKLWREMVAEQSDFVFSLSADGPDDTHSNNGLTTGHAYSILQAREEEGEDGKKVRLVQIRNPWGRMDSQGVGEWRGPWSDGSKQWTPYWLEKLDYRFGDDGLFWMSFEDMLANFPFVHRTRLFDEKWTIIQQWTSTNVAWVTGYLQTKFVIEVKKAGLVVLVLSQIDDRFFQGFEGQYTFDLHFILQEKDCAPGEYLCRVRQADKWEQHRSISCEVELEPGTYEVVPKVTASRWTGRPTVEDLVKEYAESNPQKLRQVGMQYDLSHAKGGVIDEDELIEQKKADAKAKAAEARRKIQEADRKAMQEAAKHMEEAAKSINKATHKEEKAKKDGEKDKKDGEKEKSEKKVVVQEPTPEPEGRGAAPGGGAKGKKKGAAKPKEEEETEEGEAAEEDDGNGEWEDEEEEDGEGATPEDGEEEAAGEEGAEGEVEGEGEDEGEAGEGEEGGEEEQEQEEEEEDEDEEGEDPWNAVCVMGLRVYAQDPEVTITLVKPETMEETSALTVAEEPAGATM